METLLAALVGFIALASLVALLSPPPPARHPSAPRVIRDRW